MPSVSSKKLPDFEGALLDNGKYRVDKLLGSGAYGAVYRATDLTSPQSNPKRYAIKCLNRADVERREARSDCHEIDYHAQVSYHDSIVTIHDVFRDSEYIFVVMDLCDGGDLFFAITETKRYCQRNELVRSVILQLIDGLQTCHDHGIFHCDLKPENIFTSKDGSRVWIGDFGLSTRQTLSRNFGCGSSHYMSPECIGEEYDASVYSPRHSDIWSLGVIITNLISGRNPWHKAVRSDDCFRAYMKSEDFLLQMLPISAGANAILKRIFTLNPAMRISLDDLRDEIIRLPNFFLDETELVDASEYARQAAQTYARSASAASVGEGYLSARSDDSFIVPQEDSLSVGGRGDSLLAAPCPSAAVHVVEPHHGKVAGDAVVKINFSIGSSSTSTASESSGPITPEVPPTVLKVDVPDLSDGQSMGGSAVAIPETNPKFPPGIVLPEQLRV